jgi:hypothetical protein
MQLIRNFMPQDWLRNIFSHHPRHNFRQILRSRKRFLSLLFGITFTATLLLHSLTPVFGKDDQAIAQTNLQAANRPSKVAPVTQPATPPKLREEIRGVWLTLNDFSMFRDRKLLAQGLQQLKQLNFNIHSISC